MKKEYSLNGIKLIGVVYYYDRYSSLLIKEKEHEDQREVVLFKKSKLEEFIRTQEVLTKLDKKTVELWNNGSINESNLIIFSMKPYFEYLHKRSLTGQIKYFTNEIIEHEKVLNELKGGK